jgi:hypothetical protein
MRGVRGRRKLHDCGASPVIGNIVGERVHIFLRRENGKVIKSHETIQWD